MGFWWFWKALASPNTVSIPWSAVAVPLVWTSTKMSTKMMMTHRILSIFKDSRSFGPKVGKHVGIGGCYLKVLVVWVVLCFVSFNLWGDVVWGAFKPSGSRYISCCVLSFAVFFGETGRRKHTHTHTHLEDPGISKQWHVALWIVISHGTNPGTKDSSWCLAQARWRVPGWSSWWEEKRQNDWWQVEVRVIKNPKALFFGGYISYKL